MMLLMTPETKIAAVVAVAVVALIVVRAIRNRKDFRQSTAQAESRFVISVDGTRIICHRPDGTSEQVNWSDLRAVIIETTDRGPAVCDVFWILVGTKGGSVIPQGATNEKELLSRLQALPGFDNQAVIRAMGSTENQRFLCWELKA